MGYMKAEQVLPKEIICLIQQYIDGANIYIPRKEDSKAGWGEMNETRSKLYERNQKIFEAYQSGERVPDLAQQFYLSEKSIWRIVYQCKKENKQEG
ncbi:MAG: CD3324 family protein [Eubacteriales bacterium]|nr:CD3324 family protein [Eubacteriales bacterium]